MCVVNVLLHSYPTFRMEESERLKARQALLAGALGDKLKLLSKLLVRLRVLCATNIARDPLTAEPQHTESRHCWAAFITAAGLKCAAVTRHERVCLGPPLPAVWCLNEVVCRCVLPCAPVQESRAGKFIVGDQLTHGDLQVFFHLGLLNSGWIDGGQQHLRPVLARCAACLLVFLQSHLHACLPCRPLLMSRLCWPSGFPTDLLDSYPVLKEFWDSVASVPEIAAFYSKETDNIRVKGFRPPAAAA